MATMIKICGLKDLAAAQFAADAGADAVGFVAYPPSPRHVTPHQVAAILSALTGEALPVAVFVNPQLSEIYEYVKAGIRTIQLHGDEPASFANEIVGRLGPDIRIWKAFAPGTLAEIDRLIGYPADMFLVDAASATARGGTGQKADWTLAAYAVKRLGKPVILAGGLGPDNVREAILTVKPYGVDASSRLETAPGVKNPDAVRKFIDAARG